MTLPVLSSANDDSKDFCRIIIILSFRSNFREILLQGIACAASDEVSRVCDGLQFDLSFDSFLAEFESCRETKKFFEEEWCSFFFCTVGCIGEDVHF